MITCNALKLKVIISRRATFFHTFVNKKIKFFQKNCTGDSMQVPNRTSLNYSATQRTEKPMVDLSLFILAVALPMKAISQG